MSLAELVENQEQTPTAAVVVDAGVEFSLGSWSVKRELATDLPPQVSDVRGQAVAGADVTLVPPKTARPGHFSPWVNGAQRTRAPLTLDVGLSGDHVRVFTGQVLDDPGNADATGVGPLTLECADLLDTLRKKVSLPGIAARMSNAAGGFYRPGLSPGWAMDTILRQHGHYTTAPPEPGCVVSIPCQDSLWPEHPAVTDASKVWLSSTAGEAPTFASASFGRAVSQSDHEIVFPGGPNLGSNDGLRIAMLTGPTSGGGYSILEVRSGTHSVLTVGVDAFGGAIGTTAGGAAGASATFAHDGGPLVVNVYRFGTTTLAYEIHSTVAGAPTVTTGALTISSALFAGDKAIVNRLYLNVAGILTAGVQLGTDVVTASTTLAHERGTDLDPALGVLTAVPVGLDGVGAEVLTDIAAAEFGVFSLSETAVPTFRNRDSLRGIGITPEKVTSHDKLLSGLAWTRNASAMRSAVEIPVRPAAVQVATNETIVVWEADSAIEVPAGQVVDFIVDAPGNVAALDGSIAGVDGGDATPNPSTGSYYRCLSAGGVYAPIVSARAELVGPSRIRVVLTGGAYDVSLTRQDGGPALVLRARTLITQAEDAAVIAHAENPALIAEGLADEVTLDVSPWRQDITSANIAASWLAAQCAYARPVLQTVRVVFDPRRKLADIVELVDQSVTGLGIKALIVGISLAGSAGSATQELTVRELPWTFDEVQARRPFATFADSTAYWSGSTFAESTASPMGKAPSWL